ncbi:MAG: hypothetical protein COA93_10755 [Alphaproteobacteria bacterium]|nr:MAG: hypothetical protein COA93_10755 [Alphaproteobacteria bacterium]
MISVIIPTLNEQDNLRNLLNSLCSKRDNHSDIIVVDGDSDDDTMKVAASFPVTFIQSRRGRGHQLCAGLAQAQGDIILFLHADSRIACGTVKAVQDKMDQNPVLIGGNFQLTFDGGDDFSLWLDGFYVWLRARGFYYGDSGIFIRKIILDKIGGLSSRALMEDYDLVRRMEAFGLTCNITDPAMVTSSRRFTGRRKWQIIWGWVKIHLLYHLGCSGGYMARHYDSARSSEHMNDKG